MAHLSLSLLGPLRASLDGEPLTHFHSDTALALLVYLAMNAGTPCRRTSLAGLLWSDYDESSALTNLRQALHRLRMAIKDHERTTPLLQVTRAAIALDPDSDYWLDVNAFSEALDAVQRHAHASLEACTACAERLSEAVELYQGEYLAGFSLDSALFEEWMVVERERLHGQALGALGHLAAYHEAQGTYEQAARYAQQALALEPWREEAHRALMHALALGGQRSAALAQYEACCRALREELDVEPAEETARLYEQIRDGQDLTGCRWESGGKPVRSPEPSNMPVQLTPFVGREDVLAQIGERLQDPNCRLLTLVGPGGSGKTRLALEVAARQMKHYSHGAWFVPLAPLRAVESIVPTIAGSLGFTFHAEAEPKAQLLDYLRGKHLLLVLDNAEHLIQEPLAGIAGIASEILKAAPGVKVLVTSRVGLHVQGEHRFAVEGMDVPPLLAPQDGGRAEGHREDSRRGEGEYSAIRLFLQSACRAQSDFELSDEVLPHVVRICQLVEGMPLGILLAAAWVALFSPAEIAAEISHSFDFLESDLRDVPDRQRSLRAAFDHSWNLLSEREQETFAALSVFRGSFTREAAQEVASASPRELLALVDKSLLHRTAEGRYEVHELLRQHAAEQLATSPDKERGICDRHAAYYAAALEHWAADLKGPRQQAAVAEMEAEIEDARAAWDWAVQQGQVEHLDQAMDGLGWFYFWRGRYAEGESTYRAAVDALSTAGPGRSTARVSWQRTLARVLAWQSIPNMDLGYTETVRDLSRRSLALLEECERAGDEVRLERAFALFVAGAWACQCSDGRETRILLEQSVDLYRALGARWETAGVLSWLGATLQALGLYEQAAQACREALAIHRQLGDQRGIAESLGGLGWVLLDQGDLAEAERLLREGLARSRPLSNPVASVKKELDLSAIYLLPTSWVCSLTRYQVAAISCRRSQPRQIVVTPGSPSDLRPRKPPSCAIQRTAWRTVGAVSGNLVDL